MGRFNCATWLHKAKELPKEGFEGQVERRLTGKETGGWEILYFKVYKSRLPVVEKALETAGLMLGTDKSRGYSLEIICADFLAGARLEDIAHRARRTKLSEFDAPTTEAATTQSISGREPWSETGLLRVGLLIAVASERPKGDTTATSWLGNSPNRNWLRDEARSLLRALSVDLSATPGRQQN